MIAYVTKKFTGFYSISSQVLTLMLADLMRKGKTVAELEAEIHQKSRETSDLSGEHSASSQSAREKTDDGDSTAFNKLLLLMKAGAAAPAAGVTDPMRNQVSAVDMDAGRMKWKFRNQHTIGDKSTLLFECILQLG